MFLALLPFALDAGPSARGRIQDSPYKWNPEKFGFSKPAPPEAKEGEESAYSDPAFSLTQQDGTLFVRKATGLHKAKEGDRLPPGTAIFVREDSRIEAKAITGEILRAGSSTNVTVAPGRKIELFKGAILLSIPDGEEGFSVSSPLSEVQVSGEGALMLGVTEIGGLKAIGLHGNLSLILPKQKKRNTLEPGKLLFVYTEGQGFSRKVDVELATVMQTASLVRDFQEPLPFLEDMANHAKKQNRKIRSRFRALVGDAKSDKDFELMILREEGEENPGKEPGD